MNYLSRIFRKWSWDNCLHYILLVIFLFVVYGPLIALVVDAGHYSSTKPGEVLTLVLPMGRRLGLMMNSLGLAAAVAVSGTVLGILAGSVLWRWQTGIGAYLRWFLLVLAPVPPYLHALAWSSTFDGLNILFNWLGWPNVSLTGWIGAWWVQLLAFLPIAVGLALMGFESVEPTLIEAAQLMRSDMDVLNKVILPLSAPSIVAGAGFLFLLSITDYSVPSLFSANVYSLEIFAEYSATNQPVRAMLLALPLLFITMFVVVLSQASLRNAVQSSSKHARNWRPHHWPAWFDRLQKLGITILLIQIITLIVSLIVTVGSWQKMSFAISSAASEISFTFWVSLAAAIIWLPFGLSAALELKRLDLRGRLGWLLVTAALAVPAPLIGIGLISFWSRSVWPNLYGSSAMLVLAALARFTPLAAIVLQAQFRHIDPQLIDAAHVFQINRLQTWIEIWLPLLTPGILAAAGVVFALTSGELGASLIVAPPGQATLTMRIYNYLHYGASDSVAGLCLMMAIVTLGLGCLVAVTLASWTRLHEVDNL